MTSVRGDLGQTQVAQLSAGQGNTQGNATKAPTTAVLGVSSLPHLAESWLGLPSEGAMGAAVSCSSAKPRPRTQAVLRADATLPGSGAGVGGQGVRWAESCLCFERQQALLLRASLLQWRRHPFSHSDSPDRMGL